MKKPLEHRLAELAELNTEREAEMARHRQALSRFKNRIHYLKALIRAGGVDPGEGKIVKGRLQDLATTTERNRQRRAGFGPGDTEKLRRIQNGKCAICRVVMNLDNKKANQGEQGDHCHKTGKARGLLCRTCNQTLGFYEKHQRPAGLVLQPYEDYLCNPPARRI